MYRKNQNAPIKADHQDTNNNNIIDLIAWLRLRYTAEASQS